MTLLIFRVLHLSNHFSAKNNSFDLVNTSIKVLNSSSALISFKLNSSFQDTKNSQSNQVNWRIGWSSNRCVFCVNFN